MNKTIYRAEEGYALVISLILLAILMIAGVLVSNTSVTDMGTVRNTVIYTQNAAAAESAAMSAVQMMENETDSGKLDPNVAVSDDYAWIINPDADEYSSSYSTKWVEFSSSDKSALSSRYSSSDIKIKYIVKGWRTTKGASLGTYTEMLRECVVKGVYESPKDGLLTVEVGFKKRF